MSTKGTVSTEIKIDWDVDATMKGDIQRGLDVQALFQEEDILGVSFSLAFPPLIPDKAITGQALRDWKNSCLYLALDKSANDTTRMEDFEISWSSGMEGLCNLTSPCCHVSLYSSDKGVVASGILYAHDDAFDLYEFLTRIIQCFPPYQVSLEVEPLRRP